MSCSSSFHRCLSRHSFGNIFLHAFHALEFILKTVPNFSAIHALSLFHNFFQSRASFERAKFFVFNRSLLVIFSVLRQFVCIERGFLRWKLYRYLFESSDGVGKGYIWCLCFGGVHWKIWYLWNFSFIFLHFDGERFLYLGCFRAFISFIIILKFLLFVGRLRTESNKVCWNLCVFRESGDKFSFKINRSAHFLSSSVVRVFFWCTYLAIRASNLLEYDSMDSFFCLPLVHFNEDADFSFKFFQTGLIGYFLDYFVDNSCRTPVIFVSLNIKSIFCFLRSKIRFGLIDMKHV